jgi:hypothetical protein
LEADETDFSDEEDEVEVRFRRTASTTERGGADRRGDEQNDYEEDDFVVDDDFVEVGENGGDSSEDVSEAESVRDRRRDERIQAAKAQDGIMVDKKRRMILTDDEDDS